MTVISDRVAVKELAVTTLNAAFAAQTSNPDLSNVIAFFGEPGENAVEQMVVLGTIDGQTDPDVFGPSGTDDEYTILTEIVVMGFATEVEACRRAQLILNEVNDALLTTSFAQATHNTRVFPANQDGPNGVPPYDGQPAGAVVELTIGCSCRTRGV